MIMNSKKIVHYSWQPSGEVSELNHSEATRCALYLGQEIYAAAKSFKIYELKNLSIISCLSPYKNVKLIESIGSANVKEILSDGTSDNLLPTILLPSSKKRVLLMENGLFDAQLNTPLLHQMELIITLKEFGIQIENLFTYYTTQQQATALNRLADRILEMNAA